MPREPRRKSNAQGRTRADRAASAGEGTSLPRPCQEAVAGLRASVRAGESWSLALLEAMGRWTATEEVFKGKRYRYLIQDEALNWPLLGQRLLREVDAPIPAAQRERLLKGFFPPDLSRHVVRRLLGAEKHRAFLNYWYGVVVEHALQKAVEGEVRKERVNRGLSPRGQVAEQAFKQIYNEPRSALLERFHDSEGGTLPDDGSAFTYWLFKLRLSQCEKERVASDTRKGAGVAAPDRRYAGHCAAVGDSSSVSCMTTEGGPCLGCGSPIFFRWRSLCFCLRPRAATTARGALARGSTDPGELPARASTGAGSTNAETASTLSQCVDHENPAMSLEVELFPVMDRSPQILPSGIGITADCIRPLHTHTEFVVSAEYPGGAGVHAGRLLQGVGREWPLLGEGRGQHVRERAGLLLVRGERSGLRRRGPAGPCVGGRDADCDRFR